MKTLPLRTCLILVALALVSTLAAAQQFKWTDKDGKVRYGDVPPPGVKATRLKAPPPGTPAPRPKAASASPAPAQALSPEEERMRKQIASRKTACNQANDDLGALQSGRYKGNSVEKGIERRRVQQALRDSCD
ncbi:MAG TPA: DUF4124 domain-containing protein [Burkholderiales bacterium]|nr:DUF4124 domain-containing protein [Burkholderiales bacterium]